VKWDNTEILSIERNGTIRKHKEAAHMVWAGNTISQPSYEFSLIWSTLVAEEINGLHNHKNKNKD
jgi:hypothetical protein